jgi:hypothetical protein
MGNLYRRSSIDASYQVSVHLVSGFRGEDILEIDQSETRIALWWPCLSDLLTNMATTGNACF